MVDRINKLDRENYWAVDALNKSDEDRKQKKDDNKEDNERKQHELDDFSDFTKLLQKNPANFQHLEVHKEEVKSVFFRAVSTQGHQATLELDVQFQDDSIERGVRLAVSREEGMGYLSKKPGDNLVVDHLFKGSSILTMGIYRPKKVKEDFIGEEINKVKNQWLHTIKAYQWVVISLIAVIVFLFFTLLRVAFASELN